VALTAYTRRRFLWGLAESEEGPDAPAYDESNSQAEVPSSAFGRRLIFRFTRAGLGEDVGQIHWDLVNITAGDLDDTWTTGDFTTVEGIADTAWTAWKGQIPNIWTLSEYRWYRLGPGATPPEPAVRVTPRSAAATVSGATVPPQIAQSVTLKTGLRKHWGRFYLPGPGAAGYSSSTGHITTGYTDATANAMHAAIGSLAAADFYLVVFNAARSRMFNVESIQVDDIPDVIRRRRPKRSIYYKRLP